MSGWRPTLLVAALLALLTPSGATAATVVNGDFESGTVSGWRVREVTGAGDWFAYKGIDAPIGRHRGADPVQVPPEGTYAAITDQANPNTLILFQDVALGAGLDHRLSLLTYYNTYAPIAVPTPDTLSVDDEILAGQKNQQYRIDVIKPDAPIDSVDPADILRTVFQTKPGDPNKLPPTKLTANLNPFGGQTVRLRVASAVHEEVLNAGVDAVSISSAAPGDLPRGGGRLSIGKAKVNRKNGTAILPVRIPGPGLLTAKGTSLSPGALGARTHKAKGLRKAIKPATVRAKGAGTVRIRLAPTPSAHSILKQDHKLRIRVAVSYQPTGSSSQTASLTVVLRLVPRPRR